MRTNQDIEKPNPDFLKLLPLKSDEKKSVVLKLLEEETRRAMPRFYTKPIHKAKKFDLF